MKPLTLCELNAENLFISLDYHQGEKLEHLSEEEWKKLAVAQLQRKQKPLRKLWGLASAIQHIQPDILMLIEVGGRESLDHFNRHFLGDRYLPCFVETNSSRSIDLAFLVRKDLRLRAEVISHRETRIDVKAYQGSYSARFSRDVAELRLFEGKQLRLILLLTHLKSKISTDHDFRGSDVRRAEAEALAGLYKKIRSQFPGTPVVVGGDFNSDLSSPELELLQETDLRDFHELIQTPLPERVSLVHFDHLGMPNPQVLDYLLVSPELASRIVPEKSCTYRYRHFHDIPHPLPATLQERYQMPSDHFPLVLTLMI
jgi:endonuclease/exonuclease/phosphatase family metal-dependent hydrolase